MDTIRITAKVDGFRRAGEAHPARPVDHPADAFTPEQLEALLAEPSLKVEILPAASSGSGNPVSTHKPEGQPSDPTLAVRLFSLDALEEMDKGELVAFAKRELEVELDSKPNWETLLGQVRQHLVEKAQASKGAIVLLDDLAALDSEGLLAYAKETFEVALDPSKAPDVLLEEVKGLFSAKATATSPEA